MPHDGTRDDSLAHIRKLHDTQRDEACTLHIEADNPAWVWLTKYGESIRDRTGVVETRLRTVSKSGRLEFGLAPGTHVLRWEGCAFEVVLWGDAEGVREGARVRVPGGGGLCAFRSFLVHARALAREKSAEDVDSVVLKVLKGTAWRTTSTFPKRREDSLIFTDDTAKRLIQDMRDFREDEAAYLRWSFPYKRNYLLVGPPGSGKSSLVILAASALDLDICYVTATSDMNERDLSVAIAGLTDRSLLVMEDVEVLCSTAATGHIAANSALAVLTNLLDGALHRHGLMTVLTSAHPDLLEDALTRHGRIDFTGRLKELSVGQVELMVSKMMGCDDEKASSALAARIWDAASGLRLTSTAIAHFLFRHRGAAPDELTAAVCSELSRGTKSEHVLDSRDTGRRAMFA